METDLFISEIEKNTSYMEIEIKPLLSMDVRIMYNVFRIKFTVTSTHL